MRLLLDTHALLWWLLGEDLLSGQARAAMDRPDAEIFVSAVSAMEIATKWRIGKLPAVEGLIARLSEALATEGFRPLAIDLRHALRAGVLDFPHRDPFDRLLIAQALVEDMILVSNERIFDQTGVSRLW